MPKSVYRRQRAAIAEYLRDAETNFNCYLRFVYEDYLEELIYDV